MPRAGSFDRSAGLIAAVVGTALWVALALRRPTDTFHFAPLVIALAWPVQRRTSLGRADPRTAFVLAVTGTTVAIGAGIALWATGHLDGPTFVSDGGAIVEVVLFALVGGALGYGIAARASPSATG